MKKKSKGRMFLGILLAGIMLNLFPVLDIQAAQEVYDNNRNGSITIQLTDLGTNRSGVSLSCYQVGLPEVNTGDSITFRLDGDFTDAGVDLEELVQPEKHRVTADTLCAYLKSHEELKPLQTGETDEQGQCRFADLAQGMYLIVQENGFDTYGKIQTFLVSVPYVEGQVLTYDVKTNTKGEKPPALETPPSEINPPGTMSPSETPQTGDNTNLVGCFIVLGISIIGVVFIVFISRKKDKRGYKE